MATSVKPAASSTEAPIGSGSAVGGLGSAGGEGWASKTYTVQSGDTLSKIAKDHYGSANAWTRIFEANRDKIKDPDLIYPGQIFTIAPKP